MVQDSYTKNYIKIYLWQGISLLLSFLSMFIVMPFLSSKPGVFGIYSICISLNIFLSYADLGFISAGQKYAAEFFARKDLTNEIKTIGFSVFILFLILLFFSVFFFFLGCHPQLLINNLDYGDDIKIASSLLFILALFTPSLSLQRFLQIIFGVRLENFILQRSIICSNLIKILSVLWFFRKGSYDIVGYFLFMQITDLVSSMISFFIAKNRYKLSMREVFSALRFSHTAFLRVRKLAGVVFYINLTFIIYYEIDLLVIGKFLGPAQAGIYAIGLTIFSFFRNIFGILYSPYSVRFNHYIGCGNASGSKTILSNVVETFSPLVILPIFAIVLFSKPLILSWVGPEYLESVTIVQLLLITHLFAFITYPVSMFMNAQERLKDLYLINTLIPLVYWLIVIFSYSVLGIKAFAISKLVSFALSAIFYYIILLQYMEVNLMRSLNRILRPVIIPVLVIAGLSYLLKNNMPIEKSKFNLLTSVCTNAFIILISFFVLFFTSDNFKCQANRVITSFKIKVNFSLLK